MTNKELKDRLKKFREETTFWDKLVRRDFYDNWEHHKFSRKPKSTPPRGPELGFKLGEVNGYGYVLHQTGYDSGQDEWVDYNISHCIDRLYPEEHETVETIKKIAETMLECEGDYQVLQGGLKEILKRIDELALTLEKE